MGKENVTESPFAEPLEYLSGNATLSQFGNSFDAMKESYLSSKSFSGEGIEAISDLLKKIVFEQGFINLITASKLKYMYQGAESCLKDENIIGLAYFSRAILEHTATYGYMVRESVRTIDKLKRQNNPPSAIKTIESLSNSFNVCYYGSGDRNSTSSKTTKPVHIHDAIDALDEHFGSVTIEKDKPSSEPEKHSFLYHHQIEADEVEELYGIAYDPFPQKNIVRADYDFLCDFVHPNYGSNYLVSSGEIAAGFIDAPNTRVENLGVLFIKKCLRYWLYYTELQAIDFNAHMKFKSWLERSYKRGAKATRIFSAKAFKFSGDGKTIESAYYFPGARDKREEFEMFGELLKNKNANDYQQEIAGVDNEYIVDKIITNNGLTFFVKFQKQTI